MRANRPPWLIVLVLCLSGITVSMMLSMLIPLVPEFPSLLGVSADDGSWMITALLLASAVATPGLTRLADMYGKRRMLLCTLILLFVGSVICTITSSLLVLIVGRALQGASAAMIPIGMSIMRDELPRERLSGAVALLSATFGIGGAIGLPLGGLVYAHLGWHALFWVSALMAAFLFAAVLLVIDESPVRSGGSFDYLGTVTMSIFLATLLLGITKGGHWGWTSPATLMCFAVFAVFAALWVPWELRIPEPLVDLRTTARPVVLLTNIATFLIGVTLYFNVITSTTLLQMPTSTGYGFGIDIVTAGLVMAPGGLTMIFLAPVAAGITRRFGAKRTLLCATGFFTIGYLYRAIAMNSVWEVCLGTVVVATGTVFALSSIPILIMGSVPINETAAANGLNSVVRAVGTSASSAIIAAIITTVTMSVAGEILPAQAAFQAIYAIGAGVAIVAGSVVVFLPRRSAKGIVLEPAVEATVRAA